MTSTALEVVIAFHCSVQHIHPSHLKIKPTRGLHTHITIAYYKRSEFRVSSFGLFLYRDIKPQQITNYAGRICRICNQRRRKSSLSCFLGRIDTFSIPRRAKKEPQLENPGHHCAFLSAVYSHACTQVMPISMMVLCGAGHPPTTTARVRFVLRCVLACVLEHANRRLRSCLGCLGIVCICVSGCTYIGKAQRACVCACVRDTCTAFGATRHATQCHDTPWFAGCCTDNCDAYPQTPGTKPH